MPSDHVYRKFGSPSSPQYRNHEPSVAQQLRLPDFLIMPHLGQVNVFVVCVVRSNIESSCVSVDRVLVQGVKGKNRGLCIYFIKPPWLVLTQRELVLF